MTKEEWKNSWNVQAQIFKEETVEGTIKCRENIQNTACSDGKGQLSHRFSYPAGKRTKWHQCAAQFVKRLFSIKHHDPTPNTQQSKQMDR